MKYLLVLCLLLTSCATTKPFFFAASVQPEPVVVQMTVVYGDYEESDVVDAVQAAVVDFAYRTRIIVDVTEYRRVEWQSREFGAMSEQVFALYPDGVIPARWILMIYKKTPLEWFMMFFVGSVDGMAEAGGHWAFVNRLSPSLITHELYHLGYGIWDTALEANETLRD